MPLTLQRLCANAEKKYGMQIVSGRNGLNKTVRWVHVAEYRKMSDFLHGNELVFTTGVGCSGSFLNFVSSLYERGAAGIVVNIGPYITSVPSDVIVFCEEHDFPLFTLPWETPIIDITYSFCRKIIESEKSESTAAEAFRNLIFSTGGNEEYIMSLEKLGFRESSSYTVIIAAAKNEKSIVEEMKPDELAELRQMLRKTRGQSAAFLNNGRVICIRQNSTSAEISGLKESVSRFTDSDVFFGVSKPMNGFASVKDSYRDAMKAVRTGMIRNERFTSCEETGIFGLLLCIENSDAMRQFYNSVLGDIGRYDDINGTDYEKTLIIYLENECSILKTAEILGIHRNTVNYKMKNIKQLLKTELTNETKMNIMLAHRIKQLLRI